MSEGNPEIGSVWVTLKRTSLKSKVQRNKLKTAGQPIKYRCLICATDCKKTISNSVCPFFLLCLVVSYFDFTFSL
ncbi:hypothetical protein REPUB_Repub16aG0130000 [Reevesia pubescens]